MLIPPSNRIYNQLDVHKMGVARGWDLFLIPPFVFFGFVIRLKKKKTKAENYRYSSAIDYAGGKGLLEVMVV